MMNKWAETLTTKDMEKAILGHRWKMGRYHFWEVKMPDTRERVDMVEYIPPPYRKGGVIADENTRGEWNFYELKLSIKDLMDGCPCTWRGDRNYLVCPDSMWEGTEIRDVLLVPDHVGVYVVHHTEVDDLHGFGRRFECECVKKAQRVSPHREDKMLWACFQAGARAFDTLKGRK